jgi:3-hydroxyisobutyrate dehydrogenase-like beta-hydroxyacid dehydrogenase
MSDISVLGLGLMGGALARALQQAGHKITVWPENISGSTTKN